VQQSPFWEGNIPSASQEILLTLWNPNVHCQILHAWLKCIFANLHPHPSWYRYGRQQWSVKSPCRYSDIMAKNLRNPCVLFPVLPEHCKFYLFILVIGWDYVCETAPNGRSDHPQMTWMYAPHWSNTNWQRGIEVFYEKPVSVIFLFITNPTKLFWDWMWVFTVRKTATDLLGLAKMLRQPGAFRIFPNLPVTIMLILYTLHSTKMRSPWIKRNCGFRTQLSA
jgi:hypothetical protein